MKQIKRLSKGIFSLLFSIILIFTEISPCFLLDGFEKGSISASAESNEIGLFSAKVLKGASLKSGKYVWDAESSIPGHCFIYRLSYEFSGTGYLQPGEVVMTVPIQMLKNRSGDYSDKYDIGVVHKTEADSSKRFYYEESPSGDALLIKNNITISAAESGYIDISYETAEETFEYDDMCASDEFIAEININGVTKNTTAPPVYINTSAKIKNTEKFGARMYRYWDDSWGEEPSDADDYYYIIWVVGTSFDKVTQPYKFAINENFNYSYANVVGYQFEGQDTFSTKNYVENETSEMKRYDYVLVRFKKSYYDAIKKQRFTNRITSVVTPMDGKDSPSSLTASDSYDYEIASYKPPTGHFYEQEHGNDNWYSYYEYYWDVADYGLDDLRDGTVSYLNHDLRYRSWLYGYPYPWTRLNENSTDPSGYGKRKVKFVMTNDCFYFNDNTYATDVFGAAHRDTSSKQLDANDFEIEYINYTVECKDARYDDVEKKFIPFGASCTTDDYITVDIKYGGVWRNGVGVYNLGLDSATTVNHTYIKDFTDGKITLQPNCTGYRITFSNAYYYTSIDTEPHIKLKNSSYILNSIGDKKKVYVTNVLHSDVYRPNGTKIIDFERYARDFIIGVEKSSSINQSVESQINDKKKEKITVGWKAIMSESYRTNSGLQRLLQDSGTFYILLPKGCTINTDLVSVFDGGTELNSNQFEASSILNYKNSNCTLLVVKIKEPGKEYTVYYPTEYTWKAYMDYGDYLESAAAYETGNSKIADGYPDNGGNVSFSSVLNDLDPNTNAKRFIYDDCSYMLNISTSGSGGLTKEVMGENDSHFSTKTVVRQKGKYVYKLRYSAASDVKKVVLFDSLENYKEEGIESSWKGTLTDVDLSQPKSVGINPVVYYSTINELDLSVESNRNINNRNVWKTESAIGGKKNAKAIAVDLSRTTSGSSFTLEAGRAVVVDLYMQAANEDKTVFKDGGVEYAKAYNNVYSTHTLISQIAGQPDENRVIHYNYTEVSLYVMADIKLHKYDTSDNNTPVSNVSFCLEGTSDYGTGVYKILKTDRYGEVNFKNIEKGKYTLSEYEGSDDYLPIKKPLSVVIDNSGDIYIDGKAVTNGVYELGDDPRIHADIEFCKRDLVWIDKPIEGAVFRLSGKSDYDNDILMYSTSDQNGVVTFKNVELGTYKMVETETDQDYVVSDIEYTVIVNEKGDFLISDSETLSNGMIAVTNEPYHSFYIVKQGRAMGYPVVGAVFTLKGTSNYGTKVDMQKTTGLDGVLGFNRLEAGSYILQETSVPDDYILDNRKRVVIIKNDGTVTIDGLDQDSQKRFIIPNDEKTKIVVNKKWVNDTAENRPDNIVVHVSTERPVLAAYFGSGSTANDSILKTVSGVNSTGDNVKYFSKWTGDSSVVQSKLSDGSAKKIDDGSTGNNIYGWFDSSSQTVYWYSDCSNVYLTNQAHHLFSNFNNIIKVDMTGINCELLEDCSHMFQNDNYLKTIVFSNMNVAPIKDMSYMFSGCYSIQNLNLSSSEINTQNVTDMKYMFHDCQALSTLTLNGFNTSKVTDMQYMFRYCFGLTSINTSNWNTSNVTNMQYMFDNCSNLTSLNLTGFNTAKVTDMKYMFFNCRKITGTLNLSSFNTSNVTSMLFMFASCEKVTSFNVSSFNTAKVTDMCGMFKDCTSATTISITSSSFITSNVTRMNYMFSNCQKVTSLNVSDFNTEKVIYMNNMFENCKAVTALNVSSFNAASAANTSYMFYNCKAITSLNLSSFKPSNVTDMQHMFDGCEKVTTINLTGFNTAKAVYMQYMFANCKALTSLNVSAFNTANVEDMQHMFEHCEKLTSLALNVFNTAKVKNMQYMFSYCMAMTSLNVSSFNTASVQDMQHMFEHCEKLTTLNLSSFVTSSVKNMCYMFDNCINLATLTFNVNNFNTANVTDMSDMFNQCKVISSLNVSKFNTSNVTSMKEMFASCDKLSSLNVSSFNTSKVTTMDAMFFHCKTLSSLDVSGFNVSNVVNMSYMFEDCEKIKTLNIVGWNVSNVTEMRLMFMNCKSLTSINLDNWNVSKVSDFEDLFYGCTSITSISLKNWNAKNATNLNEMFYDCGKLSSLDLSGFCTRDVMYTSYMFGDCKALNTLDLSGFSTNYLFWTEGMFSGCTALRTVYVSTLWTVSSVYYSDDMFYDCKNIYGGYTRYNSSIIDKTYARIDKGSSQRGYFKSKAIPSNWSSGSSGSAFSDRKLVETTDTPTREVAETPDMPVSDTIDTNDTPDTPDTPDMPESDNNTADNSEYPNTNSDVNDIILSEEIFTDNNSANNKLPFRRFKLPEETISLTDNSKTNDQVMPSIIAFSSNRLIAAPPQTLPLPNTTKLLKNSSDGSSGMQTIHVQSDDPNVTCEIIKNGDTWEFNFMGLDPSLEYYVWEEEVNGYTPSNTANNPLKIEAGVGNGTIYNKLEGTPDPPPDDPPQTPKYGSLKVTKQLTSIEGAVLSDDDRSRKFVFTVTLKNSDDTELTGTDIFGDTAFYNGVATFVLSGGESILFTDIPVDYKYTVEEREEGGFNTTSSGAIGTITENVTKEVQFTNQKNYTENDNVSLKLKKTVSGRYQHLTDEYEFYVDFEDLRKGETYKAVYSDNRPVITITANSHGSAALKVKLKHGDTIEFKDIPENCKYRITESAGKYTSSYVIEDANNVDSIIRSAGENKSENKTLSTALETADKGEDITVTFRNLKIVKQNLALKKVVQNASASSGTKFDFTATISELNTEEIVNTSIGKMTADVDGELVVDFQLGANDEITFYDLPVNTKYKFEEKEYNDYDTSYVIEDSVSGTTIVNTTVGNTTQFQKIDENVEQTVIFTNVKKVNDITIAKKVDLTGYDKTQINYKNVDFSFVITLSNLSDSTQYTILHYGERFRGGMQNVTYTSDSTGSATVRIALRDDEYIQLKGLPVDTGYSVTELASDHYIASYTIEKNGIITKSEESYNANTDLSTVTDTLKANEYDVHILFTNVYDFNRGYVLPAAGMEDQSRMNSIFIICFFLFGIAYILANRKEDSQKNIAICSNK